MTNQIVYHFSVGKHGGVRSIINRFKENTSSIEITHKIVNIINKKDLKANSHLFNKEDVSIIFSSQDNLYYTLKKINKKLIYKNAIFACHDWIELALVGNLGLGNPVVYFMHGDYDYYYDTAIKNEKVITIFIAPTLNIKNTLSKLIPSRKNNIFYFPYPVRDFCIVAKQFTQIDCAYYVCDISDPNKNFKILAEIDRVLLKNNCLINWHIAGMGITREKILENWCSDDEARIIYYGYLDDSKLTQYLQKCNLFILPSFKEGMPISLIESMKSGLVPLVNRWSDSIKEVISEGNNGFLAFENKVEEYVRYILLLANNPVLFKKLSDNARESTTHINLEKKSIQNIEQLFLTLKNVKLPRTPTKTYGSFLDQPLIPNLITKVYRGIFNKFNG